MPKSPLKDKPLHNPGETLEREINDLKDEKLSENALGIVLLVAFALLEWFRWFLDQSPHPILFTFLAIVGSSFFIYRAIKFKKTLKHLYQGLDGEKAVGQHLERLREFGAKVFHDIPFKDFNIDHVVIHGSGIYVIETKTYSKPDRGESKILYDGESLRFSGGIERDAPLVQVKAAAKSLQDLLKESTGIQFKIRPVLVFPGWYVESSEQAMKGDVWVLNPKALPSFIKNKYLQIEEDKVHMAALHLSRYVRAFNK